MQIQMLQTGTIAQFWIDYKIIHSYMFYYELFPFNFDLWPTIYPVRRIRAKKHIYNWKNLNQVCSAVFRSLLTTLAKLIGGQLQQADIWNPWLYLGGWDPYLLWWVWGFRKQWPEQLFHSSRSPPLPQNKWIHQFKYHSYRYWGVAMAVITW